MPKPQRYHTTGFTQTDLPLLCRVHDNAGQFINRASIVSISYAVKKTDGTDAGEDATGLLIANSCVFDSFQTDPPWTQDTTGYNFSAVIPGVAFPLPGQYEVEIKFTQFAGSPFFISVVASIQDLHSTGASLMANNKLAFQQVPSSGTVGQFLSPAVKVAITNPGGKVLTGDSSIIILTLNTGTFPTGRKSTSAFASKGVATFSSLMLGTAGTYTLTATSGNLTPVTSAPFTVAAAAPVNHAPTNLTLSAASVNENEPVGTLVGVLSTTDQDSGNTFTYSLVSGAGSTDNASFSISGNQLRTAEEFDFETKASCSIRIRATDQGGLYFEKQFTITVTDVDEIEPPEPGEPFATYTFTQGWATFGIVLPQGTATDAIQVGDLDTQTDVKTRWPDGSIRHASITAYVPANGDYDLAESTPNNGTMPLLPTLPNLSVRLTIAGVDYIAALPSSHSSDVWRDGPNLHEERHVISPHTAGGTAHAYLEVVFDMGLYNDDTWRGDITVQNIKHLAGADYFTYKVEILQGSTILFSRSSVTHLWLTRWRATFDQNGLVASQITPDFTTFYQAKAIPEFLPTVVNSVLSTSGSNWDILGRGFLLADMTTVGGRPEIAPVPGPVVQYLVHKSQAQRNVTLRTGDLGASFPKALTETNGDLFTINAHPGFWLDYRGDVGNRPLSTINSVASGVTPKLIPEINHLPTLAYIPYLITGDRFYADEVKFWANFVLLATYQNAFQNGRGGAAGLLKSNQVRGNAWGLRPLVEAATCLPDSDPHKSYFAEKVQNNLDWYDDWAPQQLSPIGASWDDKRPENQQQQYRDHITQATWEHNYLAYAIHFAHKQGFTGGEALLNRHGLYQLSLFTAGDDFDRRYAATLRTFTGTYQVDGPTKVRIPGTAYHYQTLAELFHENFYSTVTQSIIPPPQFQGLYGADARLILIIGIEKGWEGAQEAYNWLNPQMATQSYIGGQSDLNGNQIGWAVAVPSV